MPETLSGGGGGGMPGMGAKVDEKSHELNWIFEIAWYGETRRSDGQICEEHPPKLSSDGIWERLILNQTGLKVWEYRLPNLEVNILLVFFLWQSFNILFKKWGLSVPKFACMMLVSCCCCSSSSSSKIFVLLLIKSLLH